MRVVKNTIDLIRHMKLFDLSTGNWIQFEPWPIQVQWLDIIHTHLKCIVLKKRQTGMSQLTGADSLALALMLEHFRVLVLSKSAPDARVFLDRIREMYQMLPDELRDCFPQTKRGLDGGEEIVFQNRSLIKCLPAHKGAGETADRVILDEGAKYTLKDSGILLPDVLKNVEPATEKAKGQLIIISTAEGYEKFYDYYDKSRKELNSFKHLFISCWDDPTFTPERRDEIVQDFGEDHANQEYPRTEDEAFLSSGLPRFDLKKLQEMKDAGRVKKTIFRGEILEDSDNLEENDKGRLQIFHKPIHLFPYMIVADVAEGIQPGITRGRKMDDPDYSCAKVFNLIDWTQCAEWHGRIEPSAFGTILCKLGRMYNWALIVPERNNDGKTVLLQMRTEGYPELFTFEHSQIVREKSDDAFRDPVPRLGWQTTARTRPQVINALADAIRHDMIDSLADGDYTELRTFVNKGGRYEADTNCHDDRVLVLAIAYYLLQSETFWEAYDPGQAGPYDRCMRCVNHMSENPDSGVGYCEFLKSDTDMDFWCRMYDQVTVDDLMIDVTENISRKRMRGRR